MYRLCVVLLLATGLTSVTCFRPLEQVANIYSQLIHTTPASLITAEKPADKPWFCHALECPTYTVLNHSAGYETRAYEQGKWASTIVSGLLYEPSVGVGFKRLFEYISGANADGTKIPMTAPVLTAVIPGDGPFCKSNFTVSFFVPYEVRADIPKPNNPDIFLFTSPKGTIYVSQFGGFLVDDITLSLKVKALQADLVKNNESFIDGAYFTASYDPPFRVQHRHNEIWIAAKPNSTTVVN